MPKGLFGTSRRVRIGAWTTIFVLVCLRDLTRDDYARRSVASPTKTTTDGVRREDGRHNNLPPIYWINMNSSAARRDAMERSLASLAADAHRVAASEPAEATEMHESARLVFHPDVTLSAASSGGATFQGHLRGAYDYKEAACLLSHLNAVRRAYDDGRDVALILEDDARLSPTFRRRWRDYVDEGAPPGWKVLQFATINPGVMRQGALLRDKFVP